MRQRTPLTEIGEMRISLDDKSFFFKPSFAAMNELGSPKEIVELYATLNGYEYAAILGAIQSMPYGAQIQVAKILSRPAYGKKVLSAACLIMQSCCDDDISAEKMRALSIFELEICWYNTENDNPLLV